jgi:hypothetical protein
VPLVVVVLELLEDDIVDGAHVHPHVWSVKVLMIATLSGDFDEEVVEALRRWRLVLR